MFGLLLCFKIGEKSVRDSRGERIDFDREIGDSPKLFFHQSLEQHKFQLEETCNQTFD